MKYFYYCADSGEVKGPRTKKELTALFSVDEISADTPICEEGGEDWIPYFESPGNEESVPACPPKAPAAAPVAPPPRRAQKVKVREGTLGVWLIQIIGLLFCLTLYGIVIGLPLILVGESMARRHKCSLCGGVVDKTAQICQHCRAEFTAV